jgi:O-antigen ligase
VLVTLLFARVLVGHRTVAALTASAGLLGLVYFLTSSESGASERVRVFLTGEAPDAAREYLFDEALNRALTSPFGVGWGGFTVSRSFGEIFAGQAVYPHNMLVEIAVEGGWLAGAFFLVLAILSLRGFIIESTSPPGAALLGLFAYWFAAAQTSSDINGNRITWVLFAVGIVRYFRNRPGRLRRAR